MQDDTTTRAATSPAPTAKVFHMTHAAEARELFIEIAGPVHGSAWVKQAIEKVARLTGLPHRRLRGIWGKEVKRLTAEEIDALRGAAKQEKAIANVKYWEAIANRLAAVESRLAQIDPSLFGEEIRRMGSGSSGARRLSDGR